ncbi:LysR family transcriptional regulator [Photobacterium aphoticum]|uniref:LysR family transcriptional regulator n=1 Tax=Photobacterium aphoticum TaxID=754436 RepID=A0A0J1JIL7_9GAMM|nr:LysR family transcriptional regulator [Photobacterium aphoticum]KLV01832.1 LysR family transcriptional regulator [Photobacterium aphoticum]PSU60368.1 LysR family transcriptional regulator [Photobacterium aphoticum]
MNQQRKLDLNLLRVFVAAYQTQSVTQAAEQLDLTQSAVSNALSRLKQYVGSELFTRTGRGITPTRFAQELYQQIQSPLLDIESLMNGMTAFDPATSQKRFVVYCHEAMIHALRQSLDRALAALSVEVVLMEPPSSNEQLYDDLMLEKVDLIIDVDAPTSRVFASKVLTEDQLCCVVSETHPRLREANLSTAQYLDEQHVLFKMRRHQLPFIDWLVGESLPARLVYSQHASLIGMLAAVSYSDAIAAVPVSFAQQYQTMFQLRILPFPYDSGSFQSHMVWQAKFNKSQPHVWLRDCIEALVER